jgi:hypothetical protein
MLGVKKYLSWHYSSDIQFYLQKQAAKNKKEKFTNKLVARCLLNLNEYKARRLYGDNMFKVDLIDKIAKQMGFDFKDIGKGIFCFIFCQSQDTVRATVSDELSKAMLKVGEDRFKDI